MMAWKSSFIAGTLATLLCTAVHGQSAGGNDTIQYDFIVLGAGVGGLVIANRLSENPDVHVLVVEPGYAELDNPNSSYPELGGDTGSINWNYQSVPQLFADGRSKPLASGRGIGGSSLINGRVYTRADAQQIDGWELAGNDGWNWKNLFPYYKKSQQLIVPSANASAAGATYDPSYHGSDGPLHTGWSRLLGSGEYFRAVNDSMQAVGVPWNHDPAGGVMHGVGTFPRTETPGNATFPDVRADAGRSYYYPFQDRPNLHMMTGTTALRILWASPDGQGDAVVANAVEVLMDYGQRRILNATTEVIVSAGSYRSPPILEYSGIGNPRILSQYDIETVVDLPGVGENLQDQVFNVIFFNAAKNLTGRSNIVAYLTIEDLYGAEGAASFTSGMKDSLPGYAATIASMNNGATSTQDMLDLLQIQYSMLFDDKIPVMELLIGASGGTVSSQMWGTMPFARGQVHIQSGDPTQLPRINSRFWQFDYDFDTQLHAAKFIRNLYVNTAPLRDLVAFEGSPGLQTLPANATDAAWARWMKSNFRTAYHPVGTNIMLPREKGGVVDTRCKVHGTRNVRVVDASIFTYQTSGHTSANCYAVAERCADLIKEDLGML